MVDSKQFEVVEHVEQMNHNEFGYVTVLRRLALMLRDLYQDSATTGPQVNARTLDRLGIQLCGDDEGIFFKELPGDRIKELINTVPRFEPFDFHKEEYWDEISFEERATLLQNWYRRYIQPMLSKDDDDTYTGDWNHVYGLYRGIGCLCHGARIDFLHEEAYGFRMDKNPHAIYHVPQKHDSKDGVLLLDEVHGLIAIIISQMVRARGDIDHEITPVLMFSYVNEQTRALSASFDHKKDQLIVSCGAFKKGIDVTVATRDLLPWMLADPIEVKQVEQYPYLMKLGQAPDGSFLGYVCLGQFKPFEKRGPSRAEIRKIIASRREAKDKKSKPVLFCGTTQSQDNESKD